MKKVIARLVEVANELQDEGLVSLADELDGITRNILAQQPFDIGIDQEEEFKRILEEAGLNIEQLRGRQQLLLQEQTNLSNQQEQDELDLESQQTELREDFSQMAPQMPEV